MSDGLRPAQREAIRRLFTEFPKVERVVLFGSRAMGNWSEGSDIDLALFGDELQLRDELRIAARLEDLALPVRADLVRYGVADEALQLHIARRGLELFLKPRIGTLAEPGAAVDGGSAQ